MMIIGRLVYLSIKFISLYVCGMEITDLKNPTMIWGYQNPGGDWRELTRTSNTLTVLNPKNVNIGDNVFINHFTVIDGNGQGVFIDEGSQIGPWVRIAGHSDKPTKIGKYSFLSVGVTIKPGVVIGKGVVVGVNAIVDGDVPDFAVVDSSGQITGDSRTLDVRALKQNPQLQSWYDEWQT